MTIERTNFDILGILSELRKLPHETEWVEFKQNNQKPEEIGEYISALSNAAALTGKVHAWLVWGIDDLRHSVVGTSFRPSTTKVGNEELENWLLKSLSPKINFRFYTLEIDGKFVVLLEIGAAFRHPVQFKKTEYIRIGSYKKLLKDFPEKERELWRVFDSTPFERQIAAEDVSGLDVLDLLDYPTYFELLSSPLPDSRDRVLESLRSDEMITRSDGGRWNISNLGAALFAKRLGDFRGTSRKMVRVVVYRGVSRLDTIREQTGAKGYASGFEGLVAFIANQLPSNEIIGEAFRREVPMFPERAIRELVANAIIHQDFHVTGTGPMVEIFANRIEITNPGLPLVKTDRFLDSPPRSRNEALASFMRRIGVCEERGSGIDKVVSLTEAYQLPAPLFETTELHTRATLFSHRDLKKMDKADRVRACYLHACLRYVQHDHLTNTSIRERFAIDEKNSALASRLIKEALESGVIIPWDENAGRKFMKYIPWWAK
ncbi:MAG: ATP-binding protein [bacterium]